METTGAINIVTMAITGGIGIARATEANSCLQTNGSMSCVFSLAVLSPAGMSPQEELEEMVDENEFIYWLLGATASGIVFAFAATLGLCMLEYAVYRLKKHEATG